MPVSLGLVAALGQDTLPPQMLRLVLAAEAYHPTFGKTPAAGLPLLTQAQLGAYAAWARPMIDAGLTFRAIRSKLEEEHEVTAADGTMRRWCANGAPGLPSSGRRRLRGKQAAPGVYRSLTIEELEAYGDWGD